MRCVWQVHAALPDVPILGMGGVRTGLDALEFVLAGASAVVGRHRGLRRPVGARPGPAPSCADALAARGFDRLADAVGHAHRQPTPDDPTDDRSPR